MATYFHGAPEFQTDGLQTLYLMNPGYDGYSDAVAPANIVFLNSAMNSLNSVNLSHTTQQNQQESLVGIPFQATGPSPESNRPSSAHSSHDIRAFHGLVHGLNSNLWMQMPQSNSVDISSQLGLRRPLVVPPAQQGLSLSLSSEQPYTRYQPESENSAILKEISPASAEEARISGSSSSVSVVSNGISGLQSVLTSSKYLKAAQELLDEVVHVEKGIEGELHKGISSKTLLKMNGDVEGMGGFEVNGKLGAELTTAERQELQIKKTKLVSMVDEVEQRYRQYQYHMQIVVSYFEAAAGLRSARTYTALALQTISKQFRCLRDAISGRIRATSKSLGEEDSMIRGTKSEGSRLRFVDHHLRQQRALQQLGMIQHNAWRPQRGLPERAVSVLRAWLFEHFLHPYPRDSDKHMLAKQTGLTRSQVSNWFINARVRLWKPMVEEMYSEEIKEQEQNDADDKLSQSGTTDLVPKSSAPQENSPTRTEQSDSFKPKQDYLNDSKPLTIADPTPDSGKGWNQGSYHDSEARMQVMLKKARNEDSQHLNSMPHSMSVNNNSDDTNNGELVMKSGDGSGFGAYSIGEIARFDPEQFSHRFSGNGVSLTLGLPHCDSLSLSGTHPSYISSESIPLGRRLEMSTENNDYWSLNNNPSVAHSSTAYESISIQNRKRVSENYYQS